MAKKSFNPASNMNLGSIARGFDKAQAETKDAIMQAEIVPSQDNLNVALKSIESDSVLAVEDKKLAIDLLRDKFADMYNFNNCPADYESLKTEAKFLAGMTSYSFLLMAQRLMKIRDEKLYEQGGYNDFRNFIDNELTIQRSTVYNYIDLINYFGVQTFGHDQNLEPSKLIPAIPLLKSENVDIPKEEIRERFITDSKLHSAREMKKEADELKVKYSLTKEKELNIVSAISSFLNKLPDELTKKQKEDLKYLLEQLKIRLK